MSNIPWERYPRVAAFPPAHSWLQVQANPDLAPSTIDAYDCALADYLAFSTRCGISLEAASREQLACYVHDLTERPNPLSAKIRALDSGAGLSMVSGRKDWP